MIRYQASPTDDELDAFFLNESDDSSNAVDDDIWRVMELAEEYHAMGVTANREASWEEAQYYFEKALKLLANLDIEAGDSTTSPEASKYSSILENIVSDYRVSLRSLGDLREEVSSSVILERFEEMADRMGNDSITVEPGDNAQPTFDLPIVMNDRVRKSIVYYQTGAREAFTRFLTRSKKYTPMMKQILKQYGLPEDLIYLCMVESGFNPHAYSWARAMGLWQFMAATGRMYGLNRNWWLDERKDPIKATHAAARYLRDLYNDFGNWELAMASYNGGPGRVHRTMKSMRTEDFWKLKLKKQTMDYVPLIMAAAIIGKNPAKYGFHVSDFEPEIVWDEVTIDKPLELSAIAKSLDCSVEELQILNPELLRKYTPPNTNDYVLKVPRGQREKFLAVYDDLPSPAEATWVRHTVKKGESVGSIASRYGVSQYAILEANNLKKSTKIRAGRELIVPVPNDKEFASQKERTNREYASKGNLYTVRNGDNLWNIAQGFKTSVDAIRRINYMDASARIYVGQKLKIPGNNRNGKDVDERPVLAATDNASATKSSSKNDGNGKHTVRSGDTIWEVARKYGTSASKIREWNGLNSNSRIYPGQSLIVAGSESASYVIHLVEAGDTLSRIARKYGTTIARILAENKVDNPDALEVGKQLKIVNQ
ncbi:MAG: LysM peptidoglycan-binding domain-containing protein [candidate division Zixibacteria bacterium]|nr:LysM peptidoglycan-binding domain-containing protein [candidate division Zixibacteria bacterium]